MAMNGVLYESILDSIMKRLGYDPEYSDTLPYSFESDITEAINAALGVVTQLGVGPSQGFMIFGHDETWIDFFGGKIPIGLYGMVSTYVCDRCRLIFDSNSLSSAVLEKIKERNNEFEWRLNVYMECENSFPKAEIRSD